MQDVNEWPEDSVKVFLDDSLYSRNWVDHELSQLFVRNVKTIVNDKPSTESPLVRQRFNGSKLRQDMRDLVIHQLRLRLAELEKDKSGSSSLGGTNVNMMRNVIMTLADFANISQVRVLAAENLDTWLQNPSVKIPSRELLNKVVVVRCSALVYQTLASQS